MGPRGREIFKKLKSKENNSNPIDVEKTIL